MFGVSYHKQLLYLHVTVYMVILIPNIEMHQATKIHTVLGKLNSTCKTCKLSEPQFYPLDKARCTLYRACII